MRKQRTREELHQELWWRIQILYFPIPFYFSAAASAAKAFAASRIKYFFTTKRLVPHWFLALAFYLPQKRNREFLRSINHATLARRAAPVPSERTKNFSALRWYFTHNLQRAFPIKRYSNNLRCRVDKRALEPKAARNSSGNSYSWRGDGRVAALR